jgi:hypothetical protein
MYLVQKYWPYVNGIRQSLRPKKWRQRQQVAKLFQKDIRAIQPLFFSMKPNEQKGKTVLFASFLPLPYVLKMEGLFSKALHDRGWKSLCVHTRFSSIASRYHRIAFGNEAFRLDRFIPWSRYRSITEEVGGVWQADIETIKRFGYKGCPVGIHALATLSSFEPSGDLQLDPSQRRKLKRLLIASCLNVEACGRMIEECRPSMVIAVEKGFVDCCEIFYEALAHGIDYVQWVSCHEPNSIMLKRYHSGNKRAHPFSISSKTWNAMKEKPWDEMYRESVFQDFEEGYSENKWFQYKKLTDHTGFFNRSELDQEYGLDPAKKIAVIFPHILNDANLFYGDDLFRGGFREWLVETVRAILRNDQVNWILKLHPANNYRRASSGYTGEYGEILAIKEAFGGVPEKLRIMYPKDSVNPLGLFRCLDYGLTVRGTVGAEIPCFGNPVLTAGSGRYSGLGFTEDSVSADAYLQKVLRIHEIPKLSKERTRLAIKHAYLFFKVRPAKYDTFAKDVYHHPQGNPFYRDLVFDKAKINHRAQNGQLTAIIDWLVESDDEDFLSW